MGHLRGAVLVFMFVLIALSPSAFAADSGGEIYQRQCAKCHGADGRAKTAAAGKMAVSNLRSPEIQGMSDAQLYDSIAYGKKHKEYPHAYIYKGLTEKQIRDLVTLIRTFK